MRNPAVFATRIALNEPRLPSQQHSVIRDTVPEFKALGSGRSVSRRQESCFAVFIVMGLGTPGTPVQRRTEHHGGACRIRERSRRLAASAPPSWRKA